MYLRQAKAYLVPRAESLAGPRTVSTAGEAGGSCGSSAAVMVTLGNSPLAGEAVLFSAPVIQQRFSLDFRA